MGKQNKRKTVTLQADDTLNYYKRIAEVLQENEKDTAVKPEDFIDNVFSQLIEEAAKVCQRPEISYIVERLVTKASAKNLHDLLRVFAEDWISVCNDKCTSHVLQKILMVLPNFIGSVVTEVDLDNERETESVEENLTKSILELTALMLENIEENVKNQHVSHIVRAILQVLGGTCVGENVLKSRTSRNYSKHFKQEDGADANWNKEFTFANFKVPALFLKYLKTFYKRIFALENIGVYLTDINASPVIQTLLLVLHKANNDLCQKVIHKVIKLSRIKDTSDNDNIPPVVVDSVGSFLVELIVSLSSEKVYRELHRKLFKGKLLQFATHPSANYVLQKLIKFCPDGEMFLSYIAELGDHIEDILEACYNGVLVALAGSCERLKSGQELFIQMLLKGLHCDEDARREKLVMCIATLQSYETCDPHLKKVNYHGSLLLQHLLRFTDPQIVAAGLKSLEPAEVMTLSCDPCGSHVIDTIYQSATVDEGTKEAMLNKLNEHFVNVACDRNGSRTLESIWRNASLKQKTHIATCLCRQEDRIRSDRFGFHIHRNFALFHFVKRRQDWVGIQQNNMKKRKMFQDVFDTGISSKKNKKKKHRKHKETS